MLRFTLSRNNKLGIASSTAVSSSCVTAVMSSSSSSKSSASVSKTTTTSFQHPASHSHRRWRFDHANLGGIITPYGGTTTTTHGLHLGPTMPLNHHRSYSNSSTKPTVIVEIPYDNQEILDGIEQVISTHASPELRAKLDEVENVLRSPLSVAQSQLIRQELPRTFDQFEHAVAALRSQSTTSPTASLHRCVACFIILINNKPKRNGAPPDENSYGSAMARLPVTNRCASDDFTENVVNEWRKMIDKYITSLKDLNTTFTMFAEKQKLHDVARFPICKDRTIICGTARESRLGFDRILDPGIWIDDASWLNRSKAPSLGTHEKTANGDDGTDDNDDSNNNNNNTNNTNQNDNTVKKKKNNNNSKNIPKDPKRILSCFSPEVTTFIGGESGSGKSVAALIAGGSDSITLYSTPSQDDLDIACPYDEAAATRIFVKWITQSLGLNDPDSTVFPEPSFIDQSSSSSSSSTPVIRVPWNSTQTTDKNVLVVFDELGGHPNLRRAFCRLWPDFRLFLSELLGICDIETLYFIIVGTGVENFENPPGSLTDTFEVFTVRAPMLFVELLLHVCSDKSPQNSTKKFAAVLLKLLYGKDDNGRYEPLPTCPASYRFLQLMESPRCAAIAIGAMKSVAATDRLNWTPGRARGTLSSFSDFVARKFCRMNGLAKFSTSAHPRLIGGAVRCVMTNTTNLDDDQWKKLANQTGLLSDTAFWMNKEVQEKYSEEYERVPFVDPITMKKKITDAAGTDYVYAFCRGAPRFRMSKAHVAMLLLDAGCVNDNGFASAADWRMFEAATADYIMLCWMLQILVPANEKFTVERGRMKLEASRPQAVYALAKAKMKQKNNTNFPIEKIKRGMLPVKLSDESLTSKTTATVEWFKTQQASWTKSIKEKIGLVLENAEGAGFADVVALSPGRVTLVQCKYKRTAMTPEEIEIVYDNLFDNNVETLKWLSKIACAGTSNGTCELVVVLAAGFPKTLHHETGKKFLVRANKSSAALNAHFSSVHAHVTVAFPSGDDAVDSVSDLFPVLQFPPDDREAMEIATGNLKNGVIIIAEKKVIAS